MLHSPSVFPTASVEALLLPADAGDFATTPQPLLEFSLQPNGIVGDERHRGNVTGADVRTKNAYERNVEVINRQSVSLVGADDLDFIADELGIDPEIIHRNMAVEVQDGVTPNQARRLFMASCLGANVLFSEYKGSEEAPAFRDLGRGVDFGPFDPDSKRFTDATVMITRPNGPCVGPGRKIKDNYPGLLPDSTPRDFVDVAKGRRGFVGMVAKSGSIVTGQLIQFVPLGAE